MTPVRPKIGLTLPTFVDDPETLVAVARRADTRAAARGGGIDAVFTYDHLYRIASDAASPALSLEPVLGALAAETEHVAFGSLMARATIRPPAVLRSVLDTVHRLAPGRLIAGLGAGDSLSDPENEMFGLPTGDVGARLAALEAGVGAVRGRGYPVWVGGRSDRVVGTAAAMADGWNGWNLPVATFAARVDALAEACGAAGRPDADLAISWGGLVELREDRWSEAARRDDVLSGPYERIAEHLRAAVEVGAAWVILAPIAPGDPDNADIVAEMLAPLLA